MILLAGLLGAAIFASQEQDPSQAPCPTFTPGQLYPWESRKPQPGDQWAWVYLLIDKHGRAKDCRIGDGNVRNKDTRGMICLSFHKNWVHQADPEGGQADRRLVQAIIHHREYPPPDQRPRSPETLLSAASERSP